MGIGIGLGLSFAGRGGASLAADKATYLTSVSAGALIATLADPFGGGSTWSVVGSAPAALALASGGRIVAGAGGQTAGASTIVIRAAKGQRAIEEPLTFTAVAGTPTPTPTPTAVDYFATDGSTFAQYGVATNPAAAYDATSDKTFIAWERWDGIQRVCQVDTYDHTAQVWLPSAMAGESVLRNDDHGAPALAVSPNGYIFAFYGPHSNKMRARVSASPRSATAWKVLTDFGATLTYPHPVFVGDALHFFAREELALGGANNKMTLVLYTDPAATGPALAVGAKQTLVDYGGDSRFYIGNTTLGPDGYVWISGTRANFGDDYRRDVFLYRFNPANGDIENINGSVVVPIANRPVDRTLAEASFRVVTTNATTDATPASSANIPQFCWDQAGNLHVIWTDGTTSTASYLYHMVRPAAGGAFSAVQQLVQIKNRYNGYGIRAIGADVEMLVAVSVDGTRGGDIYRITRSAAGVFSTPALVRAKSDAQYPLEETMPVFKGKDELGWTFSECSGGGSGSNSSVSNDEFAGFQRIFGWGSSGYKQKDAPTGLTLSRTTIKAGLSVGDPVGFIGSRRPRETLTLSDPSGLFAISGRKLVTAAALAVGSYPISITSGFRGRSATTSFTIAVQAAVDVTDKALAIYNFAEGSGQTILDGSGNGLAGYLGDSPDNTNQDLLRVSTGLSQPNAGTFGATIPFASVMNVPSLHAFIPVQLLSSNAGGYLVSRRNGQVDLGQWWIDITNGRVRLNVVNSFRTAVAALVSTATVVLNQWALIEVEINGTAIVLRQDGVDLLAQTLSTAIQPIDSAPMTIGSQIGPGGTLGNGIRGTIGCVHLYPRALNSTEAMAARSVIKGLMSGRGITLP